MTMFIAVIYYVVFEYFSSAGIFSQVIFALAGIVIWDFFVVVVLLFSWRSNIFYYIFSFDKKKLSKGKWVENRSISAAVYGLQHPQPHLSHALWHILQFMSAGTTNRQQCIFLADDHRLNCALARADAGEPVKYNISSYHCLMSNELLLWLFCRVANYVMLCRVGRGSLFGFSPLSFFLALWTWNEFIAINQHIHDKLFTRKV